LNKKILFIVVVLIFSKINAIQDVDAQKEIIQLDSLRRLDEVIISTRKKTISKSYLQSQNIINISSEELLKAACCNISESFDTNPSIDVNFSDGLTGNKQISMLGLKSPYILITQENIPSLRGGSQTFGLTYIPGTWVESMQVTKGMGTVINGYQSMAGHINVELKKPLNVDPFFLNIYRNVDGKNELNFHFKKKVNKRLYSSLFLHGNNRIKKIDKNSDNFLDVPLTNQVNFINRWQYIDLKNGWISFLNIHGLTDEKILGNINYIPDRDFKSNKVWGSQIKTNRVEVSFKLGYVFPDTFYNSFGFQISKSIHDQKSNYGLRVYDINHESNYGSFIYNSIISNTMNKFKVGIDFSYDNYRENVDVFSFIRDDKSIGAFFEYSLDYFEKLSLTAGIRLDKHNRLNTFITPRFHFRYSLWNNSSIKASIGTGRKAANIFAENQNLFGTNRLIQIQKNGGSIYDLKPEIAVNYGFSFLQGFSAFNRQGSFSIDYYKTKFINQVVVDWENPQSIVFYNLNGESFSKSLLFEIDYSPFNNFDIKLALKEQIIETDYQSGKLQKPLTPKNRFFVSISYLDYKKNTDVDNWKFNSTLQGIGKQRIPVNYNQPNGSFSREYFLLNFQLTKVFSDKLEVYSGVENFGNYTQFNPIIASNQPFSRNFDSSIIYAPVNGRMIYAGLRFNLTN